MSTQGDTFKLVMGFSGLVGIGLMIAGDCSNNTTLAAVGEMILGLSMMMPCMLWMVVCVLCCCLCIKKKRCVCPIGDPPNQLEPSPCCCCG